MRRAIDSLSKRLVFLLCCALAAGCFSISTATAEAPTRRIENASYDSFVLEAGTFGERIVLDNVTIRGDLTIRGGCPVVELRNSSVHKVVILGDEGGEQPMPMMVSVDGGSDVQRVEVYAAAHIAAARPGVVKEMLVSTREEASVSVPLQRLQIEEAAWVRIDAQVEVAQVKRVSYLALEEGARIQTLDIAPWPEEIEAAFGAEIETEPFPLYVGVADGAEVDEILFAREAHIGGMGAVERIRAQGEGSLRVDLTITDAQGGPVRVSDADQSQVQYTDALFLPVQVQGPEDLWVVEGAGEQRFTFTALNAYQEPLLAYGDTAPEEPVVFAALAADARIATAHIAHGGELVIKPGEPGATCIVLTAWKAGCGFVKKVVVVRVLGTSAGAKVLPLTVAADADSYRITEGKEYGVALTCNAEGAAVSAVSGNPAVVEASVQDGQLRLSAKHPGVTFVTLCAEKAGDEGRQYLPAGRRIPVQVQPLRSVQLWAQSSGQRDLLLKDGETVELSDMAALPGDAALRVVSSNPSLVSVLEDESGWRLQTSRPAGDWIGAAAITVTASKTERLGADGQAVVSLPDRFKFVVVVQTDRIRLTLPPPILTMEKTYDGTASASVTLAPPENVRPGDEVRVTASAAYEDRRAGQGKRVTVQYAVEGADGYRYWPIAHQTYGGASILPLPIWAEAAAVDRVYQSGSRWVNLLTPTLRGVLPGDDVYLAGVAHGAVEDESVGQEKPVYLSGLVLGGSDAQNYVLKWEAPKVNILKAQQAPLYIDSPRTAPCGQPYVLTAAGGSGGGSVRYELRGGTGIGVIEGDRLLASQAGTFIVRAIKEEDGNYDHTISPEYQVTLRE